MTTSDVKATLDEIANIIKNSRLKLTSAKTTITTQELLLTNLPTTYADLVNTINAYLPDGAFETLAKDELSKLTIEFTALLVAATSAKEDLEIQTEF